MGTAHGSVGQMPVGEVGEVKFKELSWILEYVLVAAP
jgi:hypothetical protein